MKWRYVYEALAVYLFLRYVFGIRYLYLPGFEDISIAWLRTMAIIVVLAGAVIGVFWILTKDIRLIGPR